jgi:hypothetical protein
MKIDLIIISGILVTLSFLPFILLPLLKNREEKKLKNKFTEAAAACGFNNSFSQAWNSNLAGIDIFQRQFLLVQGINEKFMSHLINLNKVQHINLVTENRGSGDNFKPNNSLARVVLEFYENPAAEPNIIVLFDYDLHYNQDLELKNAQILVSELQKYIHTQPILKHTA